MSKMFQFMYFKMMIHWTINMKVYWILYTFPSIETCNISNFVSSSISYVNICLPTDHPKVFPKITIFFFKYIFQIKLKQKNLGTERDLNF